LALIPAGDEKNGRAAESSRPHRQAARRMEERRLAISVVYGDREHFANLAYLKNFDPRFEEALLVIGPEFGRLLIVWQRNARPICRSVRWFRSGGLRTERFQPFSLLDQARDRKPFLGEHPSQARALYPASHVGWWARKYYGDPAQDGRALLHDRCTSRHRWISACEPMPPACLSIPDRVFARTAPLGDGLFSNTANIASEAMKAFTSRSLWH